MMQIAFSRFKDFLKEQYSIEENDVVKCMGKYSVLCIGCTWK